MIVAVQVLRWLIAGGVAAGVFALLVDVVTNGTDPEAMPFDVW